MSNTRLMKISLPIFFLFISIMLYGQVPVTIAPDSLTFSDTAGWKDFEFSKKRPQNYFFSPDNIQLKSVNFFRIDSEKEFRKVFQLPPEVEIPEYSFTTHFMLLRVYCWFCKRINMEYKGDLDPFHRNICDYRLDYRLIPRDEDKLRN